MANLHLVTGHGNSNHVNSADAGSLNAAIYGSGYYVLNRGNKFAATVVSNNQIRMSDGDLIFQGRHIRLNEGETVDLSIANGSQGYKRNDLIVARYTKNASTGVEECNLAVIKGTASTGTAVDPSYTTGNIITDHVAQCDYPLYRVPIDGLNVGTLVKLFTVVDITLPEALKASSLASWAKQSTKPTYTYSEVGAAAASHNHAATNITSGTLASDRLPTVPVSKGGTGATDAATARTNLGVAASSHNHSASNITSGTLAVARGGTGLTASPQMLTDVGSETAANVMTASPRPGVTGILPISHGGTGASSASNALTNLGAAPSSHNHSASNITSGTLGSDRLPTVPISKGGTGATTADAAISNLGALKASDISDWAKQTTKPSYTAAEVGAAASSHNHGAGNITSGTLAVARGGTGQTSGTAAIKAMLAAGATVLSSYQYGTSLPTAGTAGRIFFLKK